jgi:hypothetical protein
MYCSRNTLQYVEEQVNTCGLERFAKTPTRRYGRLSSETQSPMLAITSNRGQPPIVRAQVCLRVNILTLLIGDPGSGVIWMTDDSKRIK